MFVFNNSIKAKKPKKAFLLLSISLLIFSSLLQNSNTRYSFGLCPNVKYDTEIQDLKPYLGKWFEIIRSKTTPYEKGECGTADYSINEKGNIAVENKEIRHHILTRALGEAKLTADNNRLKVVFGNSIWNYIFPGDYRIVKTDFKSYSVVYSCVQYFFMKFELVWVLVREPHKLQQSKVEEFTQYINDKLTFNPEELHYTKHDPVSCKIAGKLGEFEDI